MTLHDFQFLPQLLEMLIMAACALREAKCHGRCLRPSETTVHEEVQGDHMRMPCAETEAWAVPFFVSNLNRHWYRSEGGSSSSCHLSVTTWETQWEPPCWAQSNHGAVNSNYKLCQIYKWSHFKMEPEELSYIFGMLKQGYTTFGLGPQQDCAPKNCLQ